MKAAHFIALLCCPLVSGFVSPLWHRTPAGHKPRRWDSRLSSVQDRSPTDTLRPDSKPAQTHAADGSPALSWTQQWYGLSFIEDLSNIPSPVTVLGRPLVIWQDKGEWRVFEDMCPHRLAPLSEGRVNPETGDLQCSYHGWTFNGKGSCTYIPQSDSDEMTAAVRSPRACVKSYPTAVHQGVLFVFADPSPQGWALAAATPVPHVDEVEDDEYTEEGSTFIRDLPYGYDTLLENLMDPAHVPYAHHGARGATQTKVDRAAGNPIPMALTHMNTTSMRVTIEDPGTSGESVLEMHTPGLITYKLDLSRPLNASPVMRSIIRLENALWRRFRVSSKGAAKDEAPHRPSTMLVFYCIPVLPGKSRILARFPRNFLRFVNLPRWIAHLNSIVFTDGDNSFLHMQEREMRRRPDWDENIDRTFYMPTSSDLAVRAFRKWYKTIAGGEPDWAEGADPTLPPAQDRALVLDRYHSHVKHCSSCQGALRNWRRAKFGLGYLSIITLGLLASGVPLPNALVRRGVAGACVMAAGVVGLLHRYEKRLFFFTDLVHAKR